MSKQFEARAKVLGQLIRDARLHASRSIDDCAQVLNITPEAFSQAEEGQHLLSLPDLEALALYFRVPMGYFWGSDPLDSLGNIDYKSLLALRNRVLSVMLRQRRLKARQSVADLASAIGVSEAIIKEYEAGDRAIPYLHLEQLSKALGLMLDDFVETEHGPLGRHEAEQKLRKLFHRMEPDMQAFLLNPVNSSYLETAKMLSEMDVQRLRLVAESILDITF